MEYVDLLIIGAGPAGLSTALHLIHQNPGWAERMILLDKAAHPRHKLCAGGMTRYGLELLQDLNISVPLPIPQAMVDEARFALGQRTIHLRGRPMFVVFNREEFDDCLAKIARERGVVIHENEGAKQLTIDDEGVTVTTSRGLYRAKAVVGADGSRGIVRRALKREKERTRVARLLETATPAPETAPQFTKNYAQFDFTGVRSDLQGYTWDFPSRVAGKPHFNRGVYDSRVSRSRAKAILPHVLNGALREMGTDPATTKIEGHPIHWFSPQNRFSVRRILLVGDAAGADPLFGEGIGPALGYGKVAAEALQLAYAKGDFTLKHYRRRILGSKLGFYLLLRWAAAWWSYRLSGRPWFMNTIWSIGRGLAAINNVREGTPKI